MYQRYDFKAYMHKNGAARLIVPSFRKKLLSRKPKQRLSAKSQTGAVLSNISRGLHYIPDPHAFFFHKHEANRAFYDVQPVDDEVYRHDGQCGEAGEAKGRRHGDRPRKAALSNRKVISVFPPERSVKNAQFAKPNSGMHTAATRISSVASRRMLSSVLYMRGCTARTATAACPL